MLPGSRALVDNFLTLLHKPRYPKLPLSCTPCYRWPQNQVLSLFPPTTSSWWCPAPVVTCGKHYEFSTFYEALASTLASRQDVRPEMVQKTSFLTSGFVWF